MQPSNGGLKKPLPKRPTEANNSNLFVKERNPAGSYSLPNNIEKSSKDDINKTKEFLDNTAITKESSIQQKPKKSKKKLFLIFSLVLLVALVAGTATFLILRNIKLNQKLDTPTFNVVELPNSVVISATSVDGAKGYKYYIYDKDNKQILAQEFKASSIELNAILNAPGKYTIKMQAIGEFESQNSDISDAKEYTHKVSLPTVNFYVLGLDDVQTDGGKPQFISNDDLSDDYLSWEVDERVEKYYVCYGANSSNGELLKIEVQPSEVPFAMSNIYALGGKMYNISVIAVAKSDNYYKDNNLVCNGEKQIKIEYFETLSAPSALAYNQETKTLSFGFSRASTFSGEFEITLIYTGVSESYNVRALDVYDASHSRYSVNLTEVIREGIGKISVKALGAGYLKDSSSISIIIQ
ncbi:MAG: hypothetical protein J6T74_05655 [Clostridia bacterium]|nr:hypothetical protein [Clostridia bacterium]